MSSKLQKKLLSLSLALILLSGCAAAENAPTVQESTQQATQASTLPEYTQPQTTQEEVDPIRQMLDSMTLEEKIGQMFLVRCRKETALEDILAYAPGGYVLFGVDFDGQTPESIRSTLASWQSQSTIPMLMAVDEEGGTVCRVSNHSAFRAERFPSPRDAYSQGGLELVFSLESEKAYLLHYLGLNVNLAPVCDIAQEPGSFLYQRSLGADPITTGAFVSGALQRMQEYGVGGVMKHFPGYGENGDTHVASITDTRSLEELEGRDLLPFRQGITTGLGAIMVCHNIVTALDDTLPASLSQNVMAYLREEMAFSGVIITDDLSMGALAGYTPEEAAVLAVKAGTTMLCSTEFAPQIAAVTQAVDRGEISLSTIEDAAYRVLTWKQSLGLL